MQIHSKGPVRKNRTRRRQKTLGDARPNVEDGLPPAGFWAAWQQLLGLAPLPCIGKRRGRQPRVPLAHLLSSLVFHVMNATGTLAEHFAMLFEDSLNESGCANRRARLPWEVFAELMRRTLRPRAKLRRHPEAYWRGWRLTALDGTQFSVSQRPPAKPEACKL